MRLGGLGSQSRLESLSNLLAVLFPLLGVRSPVTIGELRAPQTFKGLVQVDTLLLGVFVPSFCDTFAPDGPILTGSIGGGERREGRTGGGDRLASNVGVVVVLPLGSVLFPGLGCRGGCGC